MKVMALREGVYPTKRHDGDDHTRRREGDVFVLYDREITVRDIRTQRATGTKLLTAAEQFSDSWMELVDDPKTPEKLTGAQESLKKTTDEIKASRRPA